MNPCDSKAMFQCVVGSRQPLHVVALKETSRKVLGDVTKALNGFPQRFHPGFLLPHLFDASQIGLPNLCSRVLRLVDQDFFRLMYQLVGILERELQGSRRLQSLYQRGASNLLVENAVLHHSQ